MKRSPDTQAMFMGMGGPLSAAPLRVLLEAGISLCAVVSPGMPERSQTTQVSESGRLPDFLNLAADAGVPVVAAATLKDSETIARLAAYHPDVIFVSCFPHILPTAVLDLPPHGCFNLHPALLPAYRGPAPLFWQLRLGEPRTGVTIHRMTDQVDAGGIVAQKTVALADGISGPQADQLLGETGGRLMLDVLAQLAGGEAAASPQDEAAGTYFPWPTANDFAIHTTWSARRAYNFIRGTGEWGCTYPITIAGEPFVITEALSYAPEQELARPVMLLGHDLWIQFAPGVLRARGVRVQ